MLTASPIAAPVSSVTLPVAPFKAASSSSSSLKEELVPYDAGPKPLSPLSSLLQVETDGEGAVPMTVYARSTSSGAKYTSTCSVGGNDRPA